VYTYADRSSWLLQAPEHTAMRVHAHALAFRDLAPETKSSPHCANS